MIRDAIQGDLEVVRALFAEYRSGVGGDVCFAGFQQELSALPGLYAAPRGALLLGLVDGAVAGCVALRPMDAERCEMKRLFVRPAFRRFGLGRELAVAIIECARVRGYSAIRLETLSRMTEAIRLYDALGFRRIEPYHDRPDADSVFMELRLDQRS